MFLPTVDPLSALLFWTPVDSHKKNTLREVVVNELQERMVANEFHSI